MLKKLVVLAITSGLAAKLYKSWKAQSDKTTSPTGPQAGARKPAKRHTVRPSA